MGNTLKKDQSTSELNAKISKLEKQLKEKEDIISNLKKSNYTSPSKEEIKQFINEFYEKNKEVDIGKISTPFGEVDILPDAIEKHLLTQSVLMSIAVFENIIQNCNLNVFDKGIYLNLKDN